MENEKIMTAKELKQYAELQDHFENNCCRVRDILRESKARRKSCEDITYAEDFFLEGDVVRWSGEEDWSYGGQMDNWGDFPSNFLTMSNEELLKIVEKENEEWEAEQEEKKKEKSDREKAERLAKYEELKKEFENE